MPRAYPQEFREDVVRIARLGELTYLQITKDVGISKTCVSNWVRRTDVEDRKCSRTSSAMDAELREACKRIRFLEQENVTCPQLQLVDKPPFDGQTKRMGCQIRNLPRYSEGWSISSSLNSCVSHG